MDITLKPAEQTLFLLNRAIDIGLIENYILAIRNDVSCMKEIRMGIGRKIPNLDTEFWPFVCANVWVSLDDIFSPTEIYILKIVVKNRGCMCLEDLTARVIELSLYQVDETVMSLVERNILVTYDYTRYHGFFRKRIHKVVALSHEFITSIANKSSTRGTTTKEE